MRQRSVAFDDGGDVANPAFDSKLRVNVFGKTRRSGDYVMRGASGNGVGGEGKGAFGALIGQVYGDDDGHAHGYSNYSQPNLPLVLKEVAQAGAAKDRIHKPVPSASSRALSFRRSTRVPL